MRTCPACGFVPPKKPRGRRHAFILPPGMWTAIERAYEVHGTMRAVLKNCPGLVILRKRKNAEGVWVTVQHIPDESTLRRWWNARHPGETAR